jgi:hypothetical protein
VSLTQNLWGLCGLFSFSSHVNGICAGHWAGVGSQLVSCLASQISCAVLWKHGTWTPGQLTAGRFQGGLATREPPPAPGPRIGRKPTQREAGVRCCGGG